MSNTDNIETDGAQIDIMSADRRVNQDSGNVEWYTPSWIMERIRRVLGGIDLDPASCEFANTIVQAKKFYTNDDDGLELEWSGTVWMNHPFGKGEKPCKVYKDKAKLAAGLSPCKKDACKKRGYHIDYEIKGNTHWINKLVDSVSSGKVTKAANICFASTSEGWFKPLYPQLQLFLYDRVHFVDVNGVEQGGGTKGAVITFFGVTKEEILAEFADYGYVK